jgi:hypothetical protein
MYFRNLLPISFQSHSNNSKVSKLPIGILGIPRNLSNWNPWEFQGIPRIPIVFQFPRIPIGIIGLSEDSNINFETFESPIIPIGILGILGMKVHPKTHSTWIERTALEILQI